MSAPSFSTRRWCGLISNPGKISAGEYGGCMASSGIISARAAMAFSTAFSSVSLNTSMTIFPTYITSRYVACPSSRNWNRAATSRHLMLSSVSVFMRFLYTSVQVIENSPFLPYGEMMLISNIYFARGNYVLGCRPLLNFFI